MARFYPAFLDLAGKDCLVVGGGALAARKARSLLDCGARVTAVSPEFKGRWRGVARRRRPFAESDLRGTWLAVAATDDEAVNRRVAEACRKRRIWANVVDRPSLCGYIVPAVVRRGALTFAVSTGGASPALAKFAGRRLRRLFGPEYAAAARALKRGRAALLRLPVPRRRALLGSILTEAGVARLGREGAAAWERLFRTEGSGRR